MYGEQVKHNCTTLPSPLKLHRAHKVGAVQFCVFAIVPIALHKKRGGDGIPGVFFAAVSNTPLIFYQNSV